MRLRSCITAQRNAAALLAQRVACDERVERDVAHGVAPHRRRQPVGDRRDRGRQTGGAVEHARLHERVLRVQLAFGRGEQPVDDLTVLVLGRRFGEAAQPPSPIEVRDARALDEDLFDVARDRAARSTDRAR